MTFLAGAMPVSAQNPVANFTANVTSGCAPLTVTFTDQSTGSPTAWNWEFSNGTLASVQNPVVTFSTPGTYSVKLVVQNATGIDQVERINYITVFPAPSANFIANTTLACVPSRVQFTDQSTSTTGPIIAWDWDFGDGNTSTLQNPGNTYTVEGIYTVTLTVTSSTGCKSTVSHASYIRIVGNIAMDFSFSQPSTCQAPFAMNFQNQSNGPGNISYNWDFGNTQTSTAVNPTTIYNAAGTYTVTLNAVSDLGCTGSIQHVVTINSVTTDFVSPANVCLNQPINFQNASSAPIVSATWDFGDGTTSAQINPSKTFLTPGIYQVKLINQYADCRDSVTKTVTVNDNPVVDFTVDDSTSCKAPFTVQFTDLTPGSTSWFWDFGDGNTSTGQNPSHQYASLGNYTVTLTATTVAGCSNTITKPAYIQIQEVSVALNVPQGGCIPFSYTPMEAINTLDPVVSYAWDFGEPGGTSNLQNPPPYVYANPGAFTVSLTVTTASGCTATATANEGIHTGVHPVVSFSFAPSNTCASDTISFNDLSVTTPGAQVDWLWNFGDGTQAGVQNPRHVFIDTGNLIVTLIVDNNGCKDSTKQTIHVIPPVARFIYKVNCITQQVTFTDTSLVDPAITPISYSWDFGNGSFSNLQNPPPVNYLPGSYTVTLTVTNGPCTYHTSQVITISNEPANFSINRNPVCKNESFTLSAINSNPANIAAYAWSVGGTMIGGGRTITYSLPATGIYSVTLSITDNNGCVTTKTIPNYITVNGPTARFTPATAGGCLNKVTTFTDASTPAGNIRNWLFDFGDGGRQNFTAPPFTHTYSQLGSYPVSLTVTDAAGCTDTYTIPTEIIITNPAVGFKADTFYCPAVPLQFVDTSAGAGLSYLWNFGDGNTSTFQNPLHTYPPGNNYYTVSLLITDISGCKDSVQKVNYIHTKSPTAAFDIQDTITICPPLRTSFLFHGSDYQSFYWNFGDGAPFSSVQNPTHFYGNYGHYIPALYVVGPGGCVDSAKASVTLYDAISYSHINYGPPTTACNSLNVDFDLTVPPGFKFFVIFGDGTIDSSRQTHISHFYPRPSFNSPVLVIQDTLSGCQVNINGSPRIDVLGAVPLFGVDKPEFCDSSTVTFTDFTTKNEPIISTTWDFGDGATATTQNATHKYTQPGTYTVTLTITTQSNCTSSYKDTIYVYRTPQPSIIGKDTICVNISEPYTGMIAQPDTLTHWAWSYANGQTSSQPNITVSFNTVGDQTLQLTTSNKLNCSSTATKTIYVTPSPTAIPVVNPLTIISGASTNLAMTYTGNITTYSWTPVDRLSCTGCTMPAANPRFTTTYKVDLLDRYGCRNAGNITVNVICNNLNFFIPNTFSPNGDGRNEYFYPRGTGLYNVKSMTIFNRWGQIVFDRRNFPVNDPLQGWNGLFNGQKASADVYVYIIEILCDNNTVIPIKGNVTLLR